MVDDQRDARRQLAGRRVLGGVHRLVVARFGVAGRFIAADAARIGHDGAGDAAHAPARERARHRVEIAAADGRVAVAAQVDVADDGAVRRRRQAGQLGAEAPVGPEPHQRRRRGEHLLVRRRIHQRGVALRVEQPARARLDHLHADARPAEHTVADDLAQRRLQAHDAVAVAILGRRLGRVVDRRALVLVRGGALLRGGGGGRRGARARRARRGGRRQQQSDEEHPRHRAHLNPRSPSRCCGAQALRFAARGPTK